MITTKEGLLVPPRLCLQVGSAINQPFAEPGLMTMQQRRGNGAGFGHVGCGLKIVNRVEQL